MLAALPRLLYLDAEGLGDGHCASSALDGSRFGDALARLRGLGLSHCAVGQDNLDHVRGHCRSLRRLKLDGLTPRNGADEPMVVSLITPNAQQLEVLHVDGGDCGDPLLAAAGQCRQLKELSVSFCELMTDVGLADLLCLRRLERLRLKKASGISAPALRAALDAGCWPRLTRLHLSECIHVTDDVVVALVDACPGLTHVALAWCWLVGKTGVATLLERAAHLQLLDVTGLKALPDDALLPLQEGHAPALRELNLRMCNCIDLDLLSRLAHQRPNLLIINYYGSDALAYEQEDIYYNRDILASPIPGEGGHTGGSVNAGQRGGW